MKKAHKKHRSRSQPEDQDEAEGLHARPGGTPQGAEEAGGAAHRFPCSRRCVRRGSPCYGGRPVLGISKREPRVHWIREGKMTSCGRLAQDVKITPFPSQVTCVSCRRSILS